MPPNRGPAALVAPLLLLLGCSAHTPQQVSARSPGPPAMPELPAAPRLRLPPSPDVASQVMGWAVLADARPLVRTLARVARLEADDLPDEASRAVIADLAGIDRRLMEPVDIGRPLAVALLNPSLLKGSGAHPMVLMLPVESPMAVAEALRRAG